MNSSEHYLEAERLAALAAFDINPVGLPVKPGSSDVIALQVTDSLTALGQLHATLALAAAHGAADTVTSTLLDEFAANLEARRG